MWSEYRCSAPSAPSTRHRTTPAGTASRMSNKASSVSDTTLTVSTTDLGGAGGAEVFNQTQAGVRAQYGFMPWDVLCLSPTHTP